MIQALDEHEAAISQLVDTEAHNLWPAVVQLFLWEDHPKSSPRPIGSGVLVRVGDAVFIFSAAHVIAAFKYKVIWTGDEENLVPLQGEYRLSLTGRPEMGEHQDDPLDAAVALLPANSPAGLTTNALDESGVDTSSNGQEVLYLLLGHPANRTEIDRRKKERSSSPMSKTPMGECIL